jgi:DNA polymerase/3'-5' exonuclease PolX
MNTNIINEFDKLINLTNQEYENAIVDKNKKLADTNLFKLKQNKKVISILKNYNKEITKDNFMELSNIDGIGKGTINRIEEILTVGKLSELGQFKNEKADRKKIIQELESVINIGKSKALEFYQLGITSVQDLINKNKNGKIELNDKILMGLKYYGIVKTEIPRSEIDNIKKLFEKIINKMNKNVKSKFVFEIAGSYRREKNTSGDIDVLLTKYDTTESNTKSDYLIQFVNELKKNIKENDNQPLLIDDLTDKNIKTKYMGFAKYLNNHVRRIDIRFVPYDSFHSALLYFTGSAELNKQMREIAKTKNMKLSEYGLFYNNGNKIETNSEKDIFDKLDMNYIIPKFR